MIIARYRRLAALLLSLPLIACQSAIPAAPTPMASAAPLPIASAAPAPKAPGEITSEADVPRVSATDLKKRIDGGEAVVIVDTRSAASFAAGHIKGALNIGLDRVNQDYSQLPKDRFVALYCT